MGIEDLNERKYGMEEEGIKESDEIYRSNLGRTPEKSSGPIDIDELGHDLSPAEILMMKEKAKEQPENQVDDEDDAQKEQVA